MASTTTRLTTFSFHHHHLHTPHSWKHASKTNLPCAFHSSKRPSFTRSLQKPDSSPFTVSSIDVSKEDKLPTVSQSDDSSGGSLLDAEAPPPPAALEEEEELTQQSFDPRRLEERFAVLNTGIYECRSCGYRYNEAVGDPTYPLPPGYQFAKLPDDWRCPTCGAAQSFFESKSVEIAGFAQNQQYGLGGNTLTSGQKALLIYGSLLVAFSLFLSGYFLQ